MQEIGALLDITLSVYFFSFNNILFLNSVIFEATKMVQ